MSLPADGIGSHPLLDKQVFFICGGSPVSDEYFMKNVTIVQETNLERKNKILELKAWDDKTQVCC